MIDPPPLSPPAAKIVEAVVAAIPVAAIAEAVAAAIPTPAPIVIPKGVQVQANDPSLPAKTTFQEDLMTAGQRQVNLIWEYTQAAIALMVVTSTMACGVAAMFLPLVQIPTIIGVAFGMVTGFYFSRTNHEKIGGVGNKPMAPYEGR